MRPGVALALRPPNMRHGGRAAGRGEPGGVVARRQVRGVAIRGGEHAGAGGGGEEEAAGRGAGALFAVFPAGAELVQTQG